MNSPKLQHFWSLTIKLFRFIYGTLSGVSYLSAVIQSAYFQPQPTRPPGKGRVLFCHYTKVYSDLKWKYLLEFIKQSNIYVGKCFVYDRNTWYLITVCKQKIIIKKRIDIWCHILSKVKLATVVEGDPKAPLSIATTPRCRGGDYTFPGLLHFTLDPYLILLSVKQGGIKYHFLSLWNESTRDWTPVPWAIREHSNPHANVWLMPYYCV